MSARPYCTTAKRLGSSGWRDHQGTADALAADDLVATGVAKVQGFILVLEEDPLPSPLRSGAVAFPTVARPKALPGTLCDRPYRRPGLPAPCHFGTAGAGQVGLAPLAHSVALPGLRWSWDF